LRLSTKALCLLFLQAPSSRSRAQARQHSEQKAELQAALKARFETELWGGPAAFAADTTAGTAAAGTVAAAAAAGAGVGVNVLSLPQVWIEASACYQAVYKWVRLLPA
jgi:hypothetical protein